MVSGFSPAQRFVLFQSLYQASQSGENNWDQVVALLSKGQQAAQRAQLDSVAAQFADGQRVVMDELREGGVFLEWELQFLQLGLAVGNLAKMYLRLAEHYRLQAEFQQSLQSHARWPLIMVVACAVLLPAWGLAATAFSPAEALWVGVLGLLPTILVCGLLTLAPRFRPLQEGIALLAYRVPGVAKALTQYQSYHFMNHLADCIAAGFSLPQALKQSARRLPHASINRRYHKLAAEVEAGGVFSTALLRSGILAGVTLPSVSNMGDAKQVPAQLGLAIHRVCEDQLAFWSAYLPCLLLGLLPYIALLNAWFLGR
ncbi:MAG: type II secretion system F family protein [Zhongshania sp.]|jgi:type II secretory pathway component PulF|nr:type II secretion system F family protein [Zhongshania sp.]